MKKLIIISTIIIFQFTILFAQNLTVTGKLVDQDGVSLSGYTVQMYINPQVYTTTSTTNGTFTFNNVTDVSDEQLPSDYSVSNNFPNPFNPTTRLEVTLPAAGTVKVELFNTIGQKVQDIIEREVGAGKSNFDLELNGLPNGIYLAKINIDDKYSVVKKLMLLYGSQHLSVSNSNSNIQLNKTTLATSIDSIVASWSSQGKKVFTNLPDLVVGTLNLGNLVVEQSSLSGSIIYASTSIPVAGVTVNIDDQYFTTGSDGTYQLSNLTPGFKNLSATKTGYDPYTNSIVLSAGTNPPLNIEMTSGLYTHNLYGTIVDDPGLQPIQGVLVTILNSDGTPSNLQTYSDFNGNYQVPTVPQGQRTVTFEKENYQTHTVQLPISNSDYHYDVGLQLSCPTSIVYIGKTYNTVKIGTQCWLKENLDVGTRINGSQPQTNNSAIEKYCYNDSVINCETYGGLYQWDEAMQYVTTQGAKGICPIGWHIPTLAEFQTLKTTVNNDGNSLKAIGQGTGGGAGTDAYGFSALLAGARDGGNGTFGSLGHYVYFWSSTEDDATFADGLYLSYDSSNIYLTNSYKDNGFSVRCIRD